MSPFALAPLLAIFGALAVMGMTTRINRSNVR